MPVIRSANPGLSGESTLRMGHAVAENTKNVVLITIES
jgi:hypothetical protein